MNGYKLLVTYNYLSYRELEYRRFMIQQWMPAMQSMGFEPADVMHTQWGKYPLRLIILYAPNLEVVRKAMQSKEWEHWHRLLRGFVTDLRYRVVRARPWFQF